METKNNASAESLRMVAEHLGVSQNKAVQIAINRLYDDIFQIKCLMICPHPQNWHFCGIGSRVITTPRL